MKGSLAVRLAPWIATVALFAVWEAAVVILKIPAFFLPPPTAVFKAIVDYWPKPTSVALKVNSECL